MGELSRETGLPVTFAALQSVAKDMPIEEQGPTPGGVIRGPQPGPEALRGDISSTG